MAKEFRTPEQYREYRRMVAITREAKKRDDRGSCVNGHPVTPDNVTTVGGRVAGCLACLLVRRDRANEVRRFNYVGTGAPVGAPRKSHRDGLKHCGTCDTWLPPVNFGKSADAWDKLYRTCKHCLAKQRAERNARRIAA